MAAGGDESAGPGGSASDDATGRYPHLDPAATESNNRPFEAAVDRELLVDFFEEAVELVHAVDRYARAWSREPGNPLYPKSLLESLHTLKGGALLCRLHDVCGLVHRLENFLAECQLPGRRVGDSAFRELHSHRGELAWFLSLAREKTGIGRVAKGALGRDALVPFSRLLPRLNAGVQQLGSSLGKPVELQVGNLDLELDEGLLRRLAMPLEHVLRDAVCHGIESPGQRRTVGKAATGRIDMRVSLQDDDLVIELEDDGQGIDAARVRELAETNGLLARDAELGDEDCAQFVFAPGLSTFGQVRPACGRGIGLSAARADIARLGGRIGVVFRSGWGARFVVRIPWAIRIERAWIFTVRNDRYAVQNNGVVESVRFARIIMERSADGEIFEHSGVAWELRYPGEFLGYGRRTGPVPADGVALLLRCGERRIALYADAVLDRQDLLIGRAGSGAGDVAAVSLATLLDDGSLVILLDPGALFEPGRNRGTSASASASGSW